MLQDICPWSYLPNNHPGQTIYISARLMILLSGHPSLKKGGETFIPKLIRFPAMPRWGLKFLRLKFALGD